MRLLIVEDELLLCTVLADHLRLSGYAVDCAYDGASALNAIEIDHYDLMILDLNLPDWMVWMFCSMLEKTMPTCVFLL